MKFAKFLEYFKNKPEAEIIKILCFESLLPLGGKTFQRNEETCTVNYSQMSSANNSSIVNGTLLKYKIQHTVPKKLTKYMKNSFFFKCNLRVRILQERNRRKNNNTQPETENNIFI